MRARDATQPAAEGVSAHTIYEVQMEMEWRDRYLIRFRQVPSQKLTEFINYEISLAVQNERERILHPKPPPLPPKEKPLP